MPEDRNREILLLLKHYRLHSSVALLEKEGSDFNTVLHVLLQAYLETYDDDFFSRFYSVTWRLLSGYAGGLLRRKKIAAEADDVVAETYGVILRRFSEKEISRDDRLLNFCYGVVRNTVHAYQRRQKRAPRGLLPSDNHPGEDPGPLDILVQMEEDRRLDLLRSRVHELLQDDSNVLTDREKGILKAYYLEGCRGPEIAARMEMSSVNIHQILFRTKKKIQKSLNMYNRFLDEGEVES